jgi:hypothetical protein
MGRQIDRQFTQRDGAQLYALPRKDGQTDRRTEMVPGSMRCPGKMRSLSDSISFSVRGVGRNRYATDCARHQ